MSLVSLLWTIDHAVRLFPVAPPLARIFWNDESEKHFHEGPRFAAAIAMVKSLETKAARGMCFVMWDLVVPNITWVLLFVLIKSPAELRILPVALWMLPCLVGSNRVFDNKLSAALLRLVANIKSLRIEPHPKTENVLARPRPCFVGMHPHGRWPAIIFPWMASRPGLFSNLALAQSSLGKFVPSVGFLAMISSCRVIDVTKKAIVYNIRDGHHTALFPGGASEMVECVPDTNCSPNKQPAIRLVKRTGFLRIAYNARSNSGTTQSPLVVPCFLFGVQDSFLNPLSKVDAWLHKLTGANLPLWVPNITSMMMGSPPTMILGPPLDPREYTTEHEFFSAYYAVLESLYETNKHRFPNYQKRSILWIEGNASKNREKSPRKEVDKTRRFATVGVLVALLFMLIFVYCYMTTGQFWQLSTMQPYLDKFSKPLLTHIIAGNFWVLAFVIQTTSPPKNSRRRQVHKWVGSIAIVSFVCICTTGYYMAVQHLRDEFDSAMKAIDDSGGASIAHPAFGILNAFVASASNVYLIGLTLGMMAISMIALQECDVRTHRVFMTKINGSFIMGILPRSGACLFRIVCPFLGKSFSYSLSCLLLMGFNIRVLRAHKGSIRPVMWSLHLSSLLLTVVSQAIDMFIRYPIVALPLFVVALLAVGLKQYHKLDQSADQEPPKLIWLQG